MFPTFWRTIAGLLALTASTLGVGVPPAATTSQSLWLVDERGEAIEAPLEVCWSRDLATVCAELRSSIQATIPQDADSLSVEGPFHGPARAQRRDLEQGSDERWILRVPRKSRLAVQGLPDTAVSLSLYAVSSPDFRQPTWKRLGPSEGLAPPGLWVPSGPFMLSLSIRGQAPDLHLLVLPPGEEVAISYQSRAGWSLLLRTVAEVGTGPVGGARVALRPMAGYGDPARSYHAQSDTRGLALFNGLRDPLLQGEVEHAAFVPRSVPGLSASPGSFGFEEVGLSPGGAITLQVSLEGEPLRQRLAGSTPPSGLAKLAQ